MGQRELEEVTREARRLGGMQGPLAGYGRGFVLWSGMVWNIFDRLMVEPMTPLVVVKRAEKCGGSQKHEGGLVCSI